MPLRKVGSESFKRRAAQEHEERDHWLVAEALAGDPGTIVVLQIESAEVRCQWTRLGTNRASRGAPAPPCLPPRSRRARAGDGARPSPPSLPFPIRVPLPYPSSPPSRRVQRKVDEPQVAVVRNMDPPPPLAADQVPAAAAGARPHARSSFAARTKPPAMSRAARAPALPPVPAADAGRGRGAFRPWRRTASSNGFRSRCCSPLATLRDTVRPAPPRAPCRRLRAAPAWGRASVTKTTSMNRGIVQ